jgi:hypothetical protein
MGQSCDRRWFRAGNHEGFHSESGRHDRAESGNKRKPHQHRPQDERTIMLICRGPWTGQPLHPNEPLHSNANELNEPFRAGWMKKIKPVD